ncbi:MAG TPA: Hsp70 family protein, partial [Candidatus Ozemobacteraceae bacterium]|nr:Hsp70 family protein [Candidatus Ozemobacteraceae bacterium]
MEGFGIDFGTTNSLVAHFNADDLYVQPFVDKNGNPHPSVVWLESDGKCTVGDKARRHINEYSGQPGHMFIPSIKRKLGMDFSHSFSGNKFSAVDIASKIFHFLKTNAHQEFNKDVQNAVVSIPVDFQGVARRELRQAAANAGIYISGYVHEPFAAVVAYAHSQKAILQESALRDQNILVFDWGGGTLDITVAQVLEKAIFQKSKGGLLDRAGDNFDDMIKGYGKRRFMEQYGLKPEELNVSDGTRDRFRLEAERAKIELSQASSASLNLTDLMRRDGEYLDYSDRIERKTFEEMIAQDLQLAMHQVDHAIEEAGLSASQIDRVLLVGGTSNIPAVK